MERARDNKSEVMGEIQTLPARKIRTTLVWTAITVAVLFALTFPLKSAIPIEWKQFLADALTYVGLGSLTIIVAAFFIIKMIIEWRYEPTTTSLTKDREKFTNQIIDIQEEQKRVDEQVDKLWSQSDLTI